MEQLRAVMQSTDRYTVMVNGAVTNEYTACDVPTGYVGLKAEGHRIEFRNLMLKELP